ncbi:MAG: NAD(P)H-dependent oxidoreductase [Lachnospiraceae bacterium]|nr:NAD(P)H-dependent oxidoreductase [Lachnospiraceae bacterium]
MSKVLFVNGSPNKDGATARLAKVVMDGEEYETLNLVDYKVYSYGQEYADDQFGEVVEKMREADVLIMGSPLYWHNICGAMRDLIDRFYGPVAQGSFHGKKLAFLFQGAAPEKWMLEAGEFTMSRFAGLYGMEYLGMATDTGSAKTLSKKLK